MKVKYEPHRRLAEKVTDSREHEYNRRRERDIINEQLAATEPLISLVRFGGDTGIDADFYLAEEMYENGFHTEISED